MIKKIQILLEFYINLLGYYISIRYISDGRKAVYFCQF